MQLFKKTIEPKTEYKFKYIADKVYLYDGEQELFKITKIYSFAEFIEEYFENECLDILEIFETTRNWPFCIVGSIEEPFTCASCAINVLNRMVQTEIMINSTMSLFSFCFFFKFSSFNSSLSLFASLTDWIISLTK